MANFLRLAPKVAQRLALSTAQLMLPDDANPAGNVHGGTMLKMVENAGFVVATRLCNCWSGQPNHRPVLGQLAQIYEMDFWQPMYVGELAKLYAKPTFTSGRSVEVLVDVWAENVVTGTVRKTNSAIVSYAASDPETGEAPDWAIPQLSPETEEELRLFDDGFERYKTRKAMQTAKRSAVQHETDGAPAVDDCPTDSRVNLVQVMLPGDCSYVCPAGRRVVGGGVVMKLMDNAAAICAAKHCGTNVVTASIDTLAFIQPVMLADIAHISARTIFTTPRSMDVHVVAQVERVGQPSPKLVTTSGVFTFVSLGPDGHSLPVPQYEPQGAGEAKVFEQRRKKHAERRAKRAALTRSQP